MKKAQFYDFGPFRIDRADRLLLCRGKPVPLTPKAFDTLLVLVESGKRLVEKDDLMQAVWPDTFVAESSLTFNISTLRKVLGEHDDKRPYIETVPRRGYRLVTEVTMTAEDLNGPDKRQGGEGPGTGVKTMAILPFRSLMPDHEYRYLGLGMADALITKLSNLRRLLVRPTSAVVKYDNLEQDPVMVGVALGVESVLEGTIRSLGETVRITVQLVDVRTKAPVWAEKFDERLTDLFTLEDSIAARLVSALMLTLNVDEADRLKRRFTGSAEAYHAYLKGRYYWNKQTPEGLQKSVEHFEQAVAIDPNYALAYAGLADAYNLIGAWGGVSPSLVLPRAKDMALKAVAIDETLAEARTSLGGIKAIYDWDWAGAEAEFKRAIEVSPGYAGAYQAYAMVCLSPQGRLDEALAEIERAQGLDPLSLFINASVGMVLNYAGRNAEAIQQLQKVVDLEPGFYLSHWCMGYAYEQLGSYEEAVASGQKARMLSGANSSTTRSLAHLYAVMGKREEAEGLLRELIEISQHRYVSPYDVAGIYAGLGDKESALKYLQAACEDHSGALVWVNVDKTFETLRGEPLFKELLRRMNLEP
jgi:DNA-binding winged helix-turn-helix (wHTH) protein/tetratricopeptide (TPR) repeat protein